MTSPRSRDEPDVDELYRAKYKSQLDQNLIQDSFESQLKADFYYRNEYENGLFRASIYLLYAHAIIKVEPWSWSCQLILTIEMNVRMVFLEHQFISYMPMLSSLNHDHEPANSS